MRSLLICALSILFSSGCQAVLLRERTAQQAQTVTGLYYEQVMDNVAMHAAHPEALPFFSVPGAAQNASQIAITGNYQPSLDLITAAGHFVNRYVLDKQTAQVGGSKSNSEQWNTTPTIDPDKILLMQYAYDEVFGNVNPEHHSQLLALLDYSMRSEAMREKSNAEVAQALKDTKDRGLQTLLMQNKALMDRLSGVPGLNINYGDKVYPGWFAVGTKHMVPKNACCVGHCGDTYAWVTPEHAADLANFALAILDIATFQPPGGGGKGAKSAFFGAGFSLFSPQ